MGVYMKLNYKRTILVGFAFFLISAFWGAYDAIVPKILTNLFHMKQGVSGFIMSFDTTVSQMCESGKSEIGYFHDL